MATYLINSPYQLFNALNYAEQCDTDAKKLLILLCRNQANHVQVKKILKKHNLFSNHWDFSPFVFKTSFISRCTLVFILMYLKLKLFVITFKKTLIIGDANYNKIVLLIKGLLVKRIVLLDDGMLTLHYSYENFSKKFLMPISRISLFTSLRILNIPIKTIINNLQYFSRKLAGNSREVAIYFIGQPLCELNILSYEAYILMISKTAENYGLKKKMVYIAHRAEDPEKIAKLTHELIHDDFTVMRFEQTLEFEILDGLPLPEIWAGCYSSALSLVSGYDKGSEIIAVDIRKMVEPSFSKQLDIVYEELRNSSVKIIEI